MKADPAAQRRLLDLADVDAELVRLAHRRRTLPEHTQLTAAETAVRAAKDALVEVETRAGDLDRDIRRLERDVEGVRARADRDQKILAGSGVGAKQATDLQHELETLARRQSVLEDEELEVMEQREAVGMDVQHAQRTLDEAQGHHAAVTERRNTALADIDAAEAGRTPRPGGGRRRPAGGPARRVRPPPCAWRRRRRAPARAPVRGVPAGAGPDGDRGAAVRPAGRGGALRGVRDGAGPHAAVGYLGDACGRAGGDGRAAAGGHRPAGAGGRRRRAGGRRGLDRPGRRPDPPAAAAPRADELSIRAPLLRARRPRADRARPRPGRGAPPPGSPRRRPAGSPPTGSRRC